MPSRSPCASCGRACFWSRGCVRASILCASCCRAQGGCSRHILRSGALPSAPRAGQPAGSPAAAATAPLVPAAPPAVSAAAAAAPAVPSAAADSAPSGAPAAEAAQSPVDGAAAAPPLSLPELWDAFRTAYLAALPVASQEIAQQRRVLSAPAHLRDHHQPRAATAVRRAPVHAEGARDGAVRLVRQLRGRGGEHRGAEAAAGAGRVHPRHPRTPEIRRRENRVEVSLRVRRRDRGGWPVQHAARRPRVLHRIRPAPHASHHRAQTKPQCARPPQSEAQGERAIPVSLPAARKRRPHRRALLHHAPWAWWATRPVRLQASRRPTRREGILAG